MAIFHMSGKVISRSQGRSAIASASYRSGERLHSDETDRTFDYRNKKGVVHAEIMLPQNAPKEYQDREVLWNAVQSVEKASNAQLAREIEFALPRELTRSEQLQLCRNIAKVFVAQGMCVDFAIHDKGDGNPHCHMMLTTRAMDEKGQWLAKEKKVYALDENGRKIPEIDEKTGQQKVRIRKGKGTEKIWKRISVQPNPWASKEWYLNSRKMVADKINAVLEERGIEKVSHLSLKDQGIDREPTVHEGYVARKMEQEGKISERCAINRNARARNQEKAEIKKALEELFTQKSVYLPYIEDDSLDHPIMSEKAYNAYMTIIGAFEDRYKLMVSSVEMLKGFKKEYQDASAEYDKAKKEYDSIVFHTHGREDKQKLDYLYSQMENKKEDFERNKTTIQCKNRSHAEFIKGALSTIDVPIDDALKQIKNVADVPLIIENIKKWLSRFELKDTSIYDKREQERAEASQRAVKEDRHTNTPVRTENRNLGQIEAHEDERQPDLEEIRRKEDEKYARDIKELREKYRDRGRNTQKGVPPRSKAPKKKKSDHDGH